jgi:hypothetical protein
MGLHKTKVVKMKNKKNMWAIALFGMLVVAMSFGIQTASAGPLGGGDSFENATQIYSGYSAEAWYPREVDYDIEYFHITVNPGQMLVVKGAIVTDEGGRVVQSVHDENGVSLNSYDLRGYFVSNTLQWSPNSEKNSYKFYIRIKNQCSGYGSGHQYRLNVTIEDHYDASTGTDAGDTFDTAMNAIQGIYDGFLSGNYHNDLGTDNKDFYKLSLESGERISVALTPPDDVKLNLEIYNHDRELVNSTQSPDKGVIARVSWTAPSAQDVYILIERTGGTFPSGTYHMDISVEPPGEHNLSITSFETPLTVAQGNILKTNVSITKTTSFEAWYTVVVSGVNGDGYPLAGTALIKLAYDSVTVPVWISIPPEAETGDYSLYADVYDSDWNRIADIGPEVVTVTS